MLRLRRRPDFEQISLSGSQRESSVRNSRKRNGKVEGPMWRTACTAASCRLFLSSELRFEETHSRSWIHTFSRLPLNAGSCDIKCQPKATKAAMTMKAKIVPGSCLFSGAQNRLTNLGLNIAAMSDPIINEASYSLRDLSSLHRLSPVQAISLSRGELGS